MAEDSEEMFVWGDNFDAILAILEEDEAIDHHFTSVSKEVSIYLYFCFLCITKKICVFDDRFDKHWKQVSMFLT